MQRKISIKCHAFSFRTPSSYVILSAAFTTRSFHFKQYMHTSMFKQHTISSVDLPLTDSWGAQERREWNNKQKVQKKGSVTLSRPHQTSEVGLQLLVVLTTDAFSSKSANEMRIGRRTKGHVTLWLPFSRTRQKTLWLLTWKWRQYDFSLHSFDSVFMMTAVP